MGVAALALGAACGRGGASGRTAGGASSGATSQATSRPAIPGAAEDGPGRVGDRSAPRTLLIEGTSLTAGLGLDPDEAWPAVLQQLVDSAGLAVRVVNAGLSGETSAGALRRVSWLLRGPVDVFVLETGANDGLRGLDPDTLRANIEAILAAVRARYPSAVLAVVQMEAPPNLGRAYATRFHAVFGEAARASGATLLPFLLTGIAGVPSLNQADGIHPTAAGARIAAATEWRALEPLLARH
jgi:acyl-CoA thioesterase-1